ncbi:MAG: hypothetical protein ACE37B_13860 [Ilumatobacter sp.]|uniref:hypothetical protein n=1 Tax=Ilumatobacter sp. TaxID=1967498 RepID=UPI00391BBD1F
MRTYTSRLAGQPQVRGACRTARWRHVSIGLIGYSVPIVAVALGGSALVESMDVELPPRTSIAIIAVLLATVVWRGATVSVIALPDGIRVRNRWRRTIVPWHEIESAAIGSSISYGLFDLVDGMRDIVNDSASELSVEEELQFSDVLLLVRRGRRRRLPVYATLGLTRDLDELRAFLDAIEAHGITIERERPAETTASSPPESPPESPPAPSPGSPPSPPPGVDVP